MFSIIFPLPFIFKFLSTKDIETQTLLNSKTYYTAFILPTL